MSATPGSRNVLTVPSKVDASSFAAPAAGVVLALVDLDRGSWLLDLASISTNTADGRVSELRCDGTFAAKILTGPSAGLYIPQRIRFYCGSPSRVTIETIAAAVGTIATTLVATLLEDPC